MWKRFGEKVSGSFGRLAACVTAFALGIVAMIGESAHAEEVTIPAMPVDFADVASKGAVVLGTVIAGVIGIFVVVSLVNMGIKWVRRAFTS